MCTADDSKLHSSIALHRTELLKSHSQELLLYSRYNILDSSKILHYFGEEFTIAWENSPNSHTKYIGQYMKSRITLSQSKTRQVLPIMVFHTRGWRLNRLNGVGFCRELSGILQTCCFSWKGHIWVQKWHQPKGVKYISRMETNNRLDANEYQLTEEQRGRQSQLHDSYKEIS